MKKSKLLAGILALAVLAAFALPVTVSALTGPMESDGSITITPPPSHSILATDFEAFKLFNIMEITGNATNGYQFAYEPMPAVEEFLKIVGSGSYGVTSNPNGTPLQLAAACEQFRQWLQDGYEETLDEVVIIALAKAMVNSGALVPGTGIPAEQDGFNIKFDPPVPAPQGLDYGYYLITGSGLRTDPNGPHTDPNDPQLTKNVISRAMLVNVPSLTRDINGDVNGWNQDVTIKLKADAPKIDKEVWYHDQAESDQPYNGAGSPANVNDPGWRDWTDVSIGDTVYFKHITAVPDMTGYDAYKFVVHDTMSKGLTFNPSSLKIFLTFGSATPVEIPAGTSASPNTTYTLTTAATAATDGYAGGQDITITFNNFIVLMDRNLDNSPKPNDRTGWAIEITYTAMLNEHAVIGAPGNPNKVKLEYSNDPNSTSSGNPGTTAETPEDEVIVYTFDLEIYKYTGELLTGTALSDAEFELKPRKGGTDSVPEYDEAISFVALTKPNTGNYDYRVAQPGDTTTTTTLITNADGVIRIKGLDAGKYGLEETKAPTGFNLPGWTTAIQIIHNGAGDSDLIAQVDEDGTLAATQKVNVLNNTGGQLPGTGGVGVYIFFGVGSVMAVLLTAAYVVYRRRKTLNALNG
ncbi:MAG: SpaH/EbpB family LPXTG-anchored major pilin [Oscillospiraceae bacterium]|nr:SpaH/EbpB family LPXTG-anchored major pilin [Oscillospiraceae bacterium]